MDSNEFIKDIQEYEKEKASNSYLMSVVFLTLGIPLPIVNLIATFIFYIGNRKGTYFVRWHCLQALLSQFSLFVINSVAIVWLLIILFSALTLGNLFISYVITLILFNMIEFSSTVQGAIKTRKGIHTKWFFYGALTDRLCKK